MAAGRQAFSFVKWTSSDHTIFFWRQVTQMLFLWTILFWWSPAISHHSVLLIFRRSLLLRLSDHQVSALCHAWTKSKSSWGNSKENNKFTFKKYFEVTQKEKIKQATKSETWRLASNALLGPSKWWKRMVCRDATPPDTPSDSDTELASCSCRWRFDWRGWGTRRWLCVLYWSLLWKPQFGGVDTMCEILQMGAHTLYWYGGRFFLWALLGISTVLFLVCIFV
jgi:hypothetical protein